MFSSWSKQAEKLYQNPLFWEMVKFPLDKKFIDLCQQTLATRYNLSLAFIEWLVNEQRERTKKYHV